MLLGDVIYNYRARHKLTLKDFSIISNLSVSYINQLEKNRNPKTNEPIVPSLETFSKVASAMGISLDQLLSIVDENQPVGLQQSTVSSPDIGLSASEQALLECYRSLNDSGKKAMEDYAQLLSSSEQYTKKKGNSQAG